jgi:hypothetical protein
MDPQIFSMEPDFVAKRKKAPVKNSLLDAEIAGLSSSFEGSGSIFK